MSHCVVWPNHLGALQRQRYGKTDLQSHKPCLELVFLNLVTVHQAKTRQADRLARAWYGLAHKL